MEIMDNNFFREKLNQYLNIKFGISEKTRGYIFWVAKEEREGIRNIIIISGALASISLFLLNSNYFKSCFVIFIIISVICFLLSILFFTLFLTLDLKFFRNDQKNTHNKYTEMVERVIKISDEVLKGELEENKAKKEIEEIERLKMEDIKSTSNKIIDDKRFEVELLKVLEMLGYLSFILAIIFIFIYFFKILIQNSL